MAEPGLTVIEKIATKHAVGLKAGAAARQGEIITIRPKHVMTHDNTSAVMAKFKTIGATRIHDPKQPVFAIDHDIQNTTPENLGKYAKIAQFAQNQGVDFYPAGTGISHQIMVEYGYATPGTMVVASDSHSNMYGGVGALGTPIVRTDAACIWATGTTWWRVPKVARVTLTGSLQSGVVGKDVIIVLCGLFNQDQVLNMAVEFAGQGVIGLTMDHRLTIANMTTEWGALAGVFPFDEVLQNYLLERAEIFGRRGDDPPRYTRADVESWYAHQDRPDPDAVYAVQLELDLTSVIPHVAGPDDVKVMHALPTIEQKRIRVDKAYLLSCVNGRLEDLHEASRVLEGRTIAAHVKFYVAAASAEIQSRAMTDGTWRTLAKAGGTMLPPGCGTCIGLGQGTLEPGEIGISATNRNFKGRMGSRDAQAYLASPAVVAASAAAGYICSSIACTETPARYSIKVTADGPPEAGMGAPSEIIDGFPALVKGRVLWLGVDNLNTDGIYSGTMTYRDDLSSEEIAAAAMANYDPGFVNIAKRGDIIVSGRNFGTGSSREQAVTCLAVSGIQCVIAASFSETYARNAFNNGFVVITCPALADFMRQHFADRSEEATIAGPELRIDYRVATIECAGRAFPFASLSRTAQQLIVVGGAENLVRQRLA